MANQSFAKSVMKKTALGVIIGVLLVVGAKYTHFPPVFQIMFFLYAILGAMVFILLDAPAMKRLEGVKAVDTTLFSHDGKWWMFVNITENEGASTWDELFLFYADHPFSRSWTPHPQNPIVSDTKSARPAGKIFLQDGQIYRPSQNCSRRYGYGLKINRIVELTEQRYREEESASYEPWEARIKGVHTYNREHHLTLIDAVYWRER